MIERRVCEDWPRILCPAPGCLMPVAPIERRERVLQITLGRPEPGQVLTGVPKAFSEMATKYRALYWSLIPSGCLEDAIRSEIRDIEPTLIWMQIQNEPSPISPEFLREMRSMCDKSLVIVDWDGDQHFEPEQPQREWFISLGRECDASLVKNTKHPYQYATMGVKHPGYLGEGVDHDLWKPFAGEIPARLPEIVLIANAYNQHNRYDGRDTLTSLLKQAFGTRFGVYGNGWVPDECTHGFLEKEVHGIAYTGARASLSMSIRSDLPRYTSDRLLFILASGGIAMVERFPDCEGLGLVDGENCFLFSGWEELKERLDYVLSQPGEALQPMRAAARELGVTEHSWLAHVAQLLAITDAVRKDR